jgi:hypothetical protein
LRSGRINGGLFLRDQNFVTLLRVGRFCRIGHNGRQKQTTHQSQNQETASAASRHKATLILFLQIIAPGPANSTARREYAAHENRPQLSPGSERPAFAQITLS